MRPDRRMAHSQTRQSVTDYITVHDWEKFQHKDATKRGKDPKWIRLYTRLHSDDDWLNLTPNRRAILIGIWIEYARSGQRLPADTGHLARRLQLRVTAKDLAAIRDAGFIGYQGDARSRDGHRAVMTRSSHGHDAVMRRSTGGRDAVMTPDEQAKTQEKNEIRQDNVTTVSSLDKKREEKSKPLAVTATQHEDSKRANTETNIDIDIAGLLKEMTG